MTSLQTCDLKQLDALLDGSLSKADENSLTFHLEECADCRDYLEHNAATQQSWQEAGSLLGTQPFDEAAEEASQAPPLIIQNVLESLAPTDDPTKLGRLGAMEVSGVVGAGAMGVVLKAFDQSLDRPVAIKLLAPHLASSGAARKRFSREAKAAAAVLHPNVMAIHSVSNGGPLPWLVMPYVRGESLQSRINDQGALPIREVLRIGSQIAAGLAAAHAQGLVHRDIKPANIMLEEGVERVAITDFGLARAVDDATMTRSGIIAGTPQYMSPEQARGEVIDQRSDLFSLGSVLYTMCTGRAPFRAETTFGVLRRITDDTPKPLEEVNAEVPPWLSGIVARLMNKHASDRFGSAAEVSELLNQCLAHLQQPTAVPLPPTAKALSNPAANQEKSDVPNPQTDSASEGGGRRFTTGRLLAWLGGCAAFLVFGIVLILEWNKGTLVIRSDAKGIPIQVLSGNEVVQEITITQQETSIRIAAGEYVVKINGKFDGLTVDDESIKITRRGADVVRIVQRERQADSSTQADYTRNRSAIHGRIISVAGELVQISVGSDDGLKKGARLVVFRDDKWVGELEVVSLRPDAAAARVVQQDGNIVLRKGDKTVEALLAERSGPAESIYNHKLKRFRFRLEKAKVEDEFSSGEEFMIRYQANDDAPRLYAAWGEPKTNSIVVIGPAEADQFIRTTLAQWEGISLGLDIPMNSADADNPPSASSDNDTRSAVAGKQHNAAVAHTPEAVVGTAQSSISLPVGKVADVQVIVTGPKDSAISAIDIKRVALPRRFNLKAGTAMNVRVRRPNGDEQSAVYASILPAAVTPQIQSFVNHNAIAIQITEGDLEQVLSGNMVTKVVYLPNGESASTALAGVESLVTTRLDPGVDPIAAALEQGNILAVLRLGNRNLELDEKPATKIESVQSSDDAISSELWKLLGDWQLASESVRGKHGKLAMHVYDHTFATEELFHGEFWYERPDKLRLDREPVAITPEQLEARQKKGVKVERDKDGNPYKLVTGHEDQDLTMISTESRITLIDRAKKTATVITTGRHLLGSQLAKRAIPLIGEVRRTDLVERFDISLEPAAPSTTMLKLVPRQNKDRKHWSEVGVLLKTETLQPKAIRWINPAKTGETRVVVTELQLRDSKQPDPFPDDTWNPDLKNLDVHYDAQTTSSEVNRP